jgi:uncharacterized membrane protein
MSIFLIILRILHIVAGVLWAGGASHFLLSIRTAAQATAPESQRFTGHLITQKRWGQFMSAMSLLTVSTARYWTF